MVPGLEQRSSVAGVERPGASSVLCSLFAALVCAASFIGYLVYREKVLLWMTVTAGVFMFLSLNSASTVLSSSDSARQVRRLIPRPLMPNVAPLLGFLGVDQDLDESLSREFLRTSDTVLPQDIERLPTFVYVGSSASRRLEEPLKMCTVCLESFADGDILRTLPCLHRYHAACVDPLLYRHGRCPLCKASLFADCCAPA